MNTKHTEEKHNEILLPKETSDQLDEILKHNPDFGDKESLVLYCLRRYYERLRETDYLQRKLSELK